MKAVCYGEILWDVFGDKKTIGGAVFNVAGHFSRLGDTSFLISSVGKDELGKDAIKSLDSIEVDRTFVNEVSYPTGCAFITLDNGLPSYSFNDPCAWDYISIDASKERILFEQEYDVFVFGTLCQRGEVSRRTLLRVLKNIKAKEFFFDVNLRLNYYTKEIIEEGLKKATILKVNDEEERVILSMFNLSSLSELFDEYPSLRIIILTCGSKGSIINTKEKKYEATPEDVKVVDTVGAGDSFSATFLHFLIEGKDIPVALEKATLVASYVVQYQGAIPKYSAEFKESLGIS